MLRSIIWWDCWRYVPLLFLTPNIQKEESEECMTITETIMSIIHQHRDNSVSGSQTLSPPIQDTVMDFLAQDNAILRPVSYIRMHMSPFFLSVRVG